MNTTSEMQLVQIDKLIPYVNNARTHSPEQLNKLRFFAAGIRVYKSCYHRQGFQCYRRSRQNTCCKSREHLRSSLRFCGLPYARSEESVHNRRQPNGS